MSQIKIEANPSGGGIYTLQSGAGSTDRTITLPDKAGEVAVGAGTIVQVVQAVNSTTFTTTSTSYADDGLTASITPTSSSNKILVITNHQMSFGRTNNFAAAGIRLLRDSTTVYTPQTATGGQVGDYYIQVNTGSSHAFNNQRAMITYLDSPSTTSSITYKTQCATAYSSTMTINSSGSTNGSSYMTLMEVVA